MPGFVAHYKSCQDNLLKIKAFRLGVEAPDIFKKWLEKDKTIDKVKNKYLSLNIEEVPPITSKLFNRVLELEENHKPYGMHYGWSGDPDIMAFWSELNEDEKNSPFYRGYLWHLLTDLLVYNALGTDSNCKWELLNEEEQEQLLNDIHREWDMTNQLLVEIYGNIELSPEVLELGIVQFIEFNKLNHINVDILIECINYFRQYNPLVDDVNVIIREVMTMAARMKLLKYDENRYLECKKIIQGINQKSKYLKKQIK